MALITLINGAPLISTSELTLVFLMTRTLDLNFVDIVGIRVEPLVHVPNIKNDNSQINRGSTIKINHFFITLKLLGLQYGLFSNGNLCHASGTALR